MERPPLDELLELFGATLAVPEGVTTAPGAVAGNSFIDAGLAGAGANSFFSMLAVLYPGQPRLVDSFDITGFNNATGEVTLSTAYKGVAAPIPAGVPYKIVTFRFVPAEVAAVLASLGLMADAATADDLSNVTTTSAHAKLRRLLLRLSSDAFTATIQGAARTELDTMLYQLATYISALGAAYSATVNPGAAAKANIEQTLEDLGDMLAGATGIVTFPAALPPANGVSIAEVIHYISDAVDALSTLYETGGTLLADGTEQNVVIDNAPASVFVPIKAMIDLTNMAAGDTTIIRLYYRIAAAGGLVLKDTVTYTGAQDPDLINVELEPNRHGFKVTLQQTAGVNRNYGWEYFYES